MGTRKWLHAGPELGRTYFWQKNCHSLTHTHSLERLFRCLDGQRSLESPVFATIFHPDRSNLQSNLFLSLLQVPPVRNISWICRHPGQFGLSVYLWRDLGGSQELEWKVANLGCGSSGRGFKQARSDATVCEAGYTSFCSSRETATGGRKFFMTALLQKSFTNQKNKKTICKLESPWAVGTEISLGHVKAPGTNKLTFSVLAFWFNHPKN